MTAGVSGWTRVDGAFLLLTAIIVGLSAWLLTPAHVDDSHIYLRIASNIAAGNGWVFNVGEQTNAATSTAYTLFLVALGSIVGFSTQMVSLAYALTIGSLLLVLYAAWREKGRLFAAYVAVGTVAGTDCLHAFGLESCLLLTVVAMTALMYERKGDSFWTGAFAGLTVLARPEGVILLLLIGAMELIVRRRLAWRSALGAIIIVSPWLVFSTLYFGSAFSHTAEIKSLQRNYGYWATRPDFIFLYVWHAKYLLAGIAAAAVGLWMFRLRPTALERPFSILCIAFGLLQVLGYQLLKAPAAYPWYDVPGNFSLSLALMLMAGTLAIAQPKALMAIGVAIAAPILAARAGFIIPGEYRFTADYRVVGAYMRANSEPTDTFAATEIGFLGVYSGLQTLDTHGLLHRRSLPELRKHNLHWWWDLGERPTYVVNHRYPGDGEPGNATWPEALTQEFRAQYTPVFEHGSLILYKRNEAGPT